MDFAFTATIIEWRGPSPYFYARLPAAEAGAVREMSKLVSYGWGAVPVTATIASVTFTTSLFPKDGTYLLPIKAAVRKRAGVTVGDLVAIEMRIAPR